MNMPIEIVEYEAKYLSAFRDLNIAWITQYFEIEEADEIALNSPEDYILKSGGAIFVALLENQPVGVCALIKRQNDPYPYELAKMAVSEKFRGYGVGFLLGEAIIKKAKELGAKELFLESNRSLTPALSLYSKLGFYEIEGVQSPFARCNIQMKLNLV